MALTRLKGSQILDNTITIADLAVADGTPGQGLLTDGSGGLSFGNVATSIDIPNPTLFAGGTHSSQSSYTLAHDPGSANGIQVYVDDVLQRPATNYGVIGTTLTFTATPADTADIYIIYEGFYLGIGTVADASITSAKFANNSITVDKLAIANFATPETFTGVTNQTSFVLAMNPGSAYAIFVYLNTVFQRPGPDYTLTTASGITSLIFTTAPAAGDEIYVRYGMQAMPSGISSVADGTLTIAKFAPSTFLVDSFVVTASAGQQDFTLSRNPGSVYALFVVVEGIIQKPLTHYTVSGTTLSFASVLPIDSEVEVHLNGFPSPLNAPADATVGRLTLLTTNSSASGLVLKVSSNNTDLEWGSIDSFPTQTSNSGKFLITDGTNVSWATVAQYTLPTQTSNSGKYLTTDGTNESWADVPAVTVSDTPPGSPSHSDLWWDSVLGKLKIYYNDGTSSQWVDAHQIGTIDPAMGGDLTGATSNAQIVANAVGITELNVTDGTVGQALTTDGSGTLGFADAGASVTISDTAPGSASAGDLWWKSDTGRLKVYYDDGSGVQWVDAFPVGSIDPTMGGDLTGTASNAQIAANVVGITELNVTDGTAGQALMTNGSGTLNFGNVDALPSQTGQAGEYLQTDGTTATWEPVSSSGAAYDAATTSTGYFDIPSGTDAQRPGSPGTGMLRYNSDQTQLEHYADGGWIGFAGSTPTITSIQPTLSITAGTTITVIGINFQAGTTVKLIGTDASQYNAQSVTFVSSTEIQFSTPELPVAYEPFDVQLTLPNGGVAISTNIIDAGGVPAWTTAAGLLGTIPDDFAGNHFTLAATDPDSQVVTFSMDTTNTTILTGAGLALNGTTGVISGDPTDVSSATTYNFDVIATDSTGVNSTTRSFSITVVQPYYTGASGGTTATYTDGGVNYKSHTFTGSGTFNAGTGGIADVLLVAGGGAGSNWHGGGGGAGGMQTFQITATATTYSIVVGNGGAGGTTSRGSNGGDSEAFGTTSLGGGIGGNWSTGGGGDGMAQIGGSGGGGGATGGSPWFAGAAGTTGQGNAGGDGFSDHCSGGGGGKGAVGETAGPNYYAGDGGIGAINTYRDGTDIYYAGGGGGGTWQGGTSENGDGGLGGGGYGSCNSNSTAPSAGSANTGGGGGGHGGQGNNTSWASQTTGGSGIVVIRYMVS